jgi:PAS domain S-box-containing protein
MVSVRSGTAAVAAVIEHPGCLLLLDYVLPDMDGREVVAELAARGRSVPFIVMTGHGDERIAVDMMKLGARDYLVKLPDILDLMPPVVERALGELLADRRLSQAEAALRAEKERAKEYLAIAHVMMVALDADGRVTLVNRFACEALGCREDELIGRSWVDTCIPESLRDEVRGFYRRLMSGAAEPAEYRETPVVCCSGAERLVAWKTVVLRDASGAPSGTLSSGEDITERQAAVNALRESEKKFRAIFDSATDGMFLVEQTDQQLTLSNRSCLRTLGYDAEQFAGLHLADLHPEEDLPAMSDLVASSVLPEQDRRREIRFRRRDGMLFPADANSAAITLNGRGCTLIVFRDITRRKQAEAELLKYREHLEELVRARTHDLEIVNKELEAFSYSVSHDLRAPLRAINGFAQALQEDCADRLDSEGRDYIQRIRASSRHMAELIDDLLNLARIARLPLERRPVNLSDLARTLATDLRDLEPARRVEFVIRDGMVAQADPVLAELVLRNLLDNAWKFTGKHRSARIEVGEGEHNGERVWYVRDDGAGFDMAYVASLSAPFQRLHTAEEFTGTGIGLATVQRILRRHGGRGWLEGAVEQGATYYFTFATADKTKEQ